VRSLPAFAVPGLIFVFLVAAGWCARVPLLSTISVEFATLAAIPLFLAGLWLGAVAAHNTRDWDAADRFLAALLPGSLAVFAFASFPLMIGYSVSPDIRICSTTFPWPVYYFIAGGAAFTGFYWAFASAIFFGRRTLRFLFLSLLVAASVVFSVLDFGWGARLVPLNPIFGYLGFYGVASSGAIPAVAWSHRVFYLALALCAVAIGIALRTRAPADRRLRTLLLAFFGPLCAFLAVLAISRRDVGGLLPGTLRLRESLSEKVESDHIRLYYHPGSWSPDALSQNLGTLEWAYRKNAAILTPETKRKINAYLYDAWEKKRLTGAEDVVFASTTRYAIHITGSDSPDLLRHELAHAMASPFGLPVIGVPLSLPMIEGLADAVSRDYAVSDPAHALVAASLRNGTLPPADSLMTNLGFLKLHTRLSYAFGGSFVGFLIRKYGAEPVLDSYRGKRLADAIGKPLKILDDEWRAFLSGVPMAREEQKLARDYYNPRTVKPFYSSLCPRERTQMTARIRFFVTAKRLDEAERLVRVYATREPGNPDWLSAQVSIAIGRREFEQAEELLARMDEEGVPTRYLLGGWNRLLREYEAEWFKDPKSSQNAANVERALVAIVNLEYMGGRALVVPLQLKAVRGSPSETRLYRALIHYCAGPSRGLLSRWAEGRDALAQRVLWLHCNPSEVSLEEFANLKDRVAHASEPVLEEVFREALQGWVYARTEEKRYDEVIRGLRLLIDLAPPSRKPQYQTSLEIAEFFRDWEGPFP
jgi:hypothetical protein